MECDGKFWDEDILNDLFSARDKDLILMVPLSTRDVEDSWFWQLERRGDYTVKSGYRLLQERRVMFGGNPSLGWTLIWKLSISPKVEIFLWRAAADFLPTMLALQRRRVVSTSSYPCCSAALEDTLHAVFQCSAICNIWNQVQLEVRIDGALSFVDCWAVHGCTLTKEKLQQVAMLCWEVWNRRNQWVWNRKNVGKIRVSFSPN